MNAHVLNKRHDRVPTDAVYVGRPTFWGNPFAIGRDGTRDECVELFRAWLWTQPERLERLSELGGKTLVCWCAPAACHGDVLSAAARWAAANPDALGRRISELRRFG